MHRRPICRGIPGGSGALGTMPAMDAAPLGPAASVDASPEGATDERPSGPQRAVAGPVRPAPSDPAVAVADPAVAAADPEGPAYSSVLRTALAVGTVLALVAALVLRFWTSSDLWLDEALTVNISKLPIHEIPSYLRRDGAPPLFYFLLHFWMGVFGSSDLAVRALPGCSASPPSPSSGWPGAAWADAPRRGRRCCSWRPRRSPSATTPRRGCTRWSPCSPCAASWPSTGRSGRRGRAT